MGVGELLANSRGVRPSSREFARVRASSRRTIVRRVYSREIREEGREMRQRYTLKSDKEGQYKEGGERREGG